MVDPVHVEAMLKMLRRNGVAAFKCEQYELVLEAQPMAAEPEIDPEVEKPNRGVDEVNMAYDHLGFDPDKMFPAKTK